MRDRKFIKNCVICNSNNFKNVLQKRSYQLVKCSKCGLFFINPQPTDSELKKVYSSKGGYFVNTLDNDENPEFAKRIALLKRFDCNGNVLDIGCANGDFLYQAEKQGLRGSGIDIDPDLVKRAKKRGLNARVGSDEQMKFKKNSFEFIHLGDIIEHSRDPDRLLSNCHKILKPNGIVIISTPNIGSFFSRATYLFKNLFGIQWGHPTPPYHLYEFSYETLAELLKKRNFKIIDSYFSRISLSYSISATGYFDNIKKGYKKTRDTKGIINGILKNGLGNNLLLAGVFLLYGSASLLDSLMFRINKKANQMVIVAEKVKEKDL